MIEKTTDWLDAAAEQTSREREASIAASRKAVADMPEGEPGECERCGENSLRLVFGACARCRTKYNLP